MKKTFLLVITFMISSSLTFAGYEKQVLSLEASLDKVNIQELSSGLSPKKIEKSKKKIEKVFDRKISKAKRKNKSLDEALLDLEISLEETYVKTLRAKRKLSKKKTMDKVLKKFRAKDPDLKSQDILDNMAKLSDRDSFESHKKSLLSMLKSAGSEVAFLQKMKVKMLKEADTASLKLNPKKGRAVASIEDPLGFIWGITLMGASVTGIILLVSAGTALAIIGAILLVVVLIWGFLVALFSIHPIR